MEASHILNIMKIVPNLAPKIAVLGVVRHVEISTILAENRKIFLFERA